MASAPSPYTVSVGNATGISVSRRCRAASRRWAASRLLSSRVTIKSSKGDSELVAKPTWPMFEMSTDKTRVFIGG